jgi:signal transduction histidine kinase
MGDSLSSDATCLPGRDRSPHAPAFLSACELLSAISHEMRNALTVLQTYAELAQQEPSFVDKALTVVRRQGRQLDLLANDLLSAASLEAGHLALRRTSMDLVALLRGCVEQAQAMYPDQMYRIIATDEVVDGRWDPARLEQVFTNLLSNAAKYSPSAGEIEVSLEDLGEMVRVTVKDHGVGISPETRPWLFDPFFRVESEETDGIKGNGLGLYVTQMLVSAHCGQITVDSAPGRGSTFSVTLPRGFHHQPVGTAGHGCGRASTW